jgi:peroxygenase
MAPDKKEKGEDNAWRVQSQPITGERPPPVGIESRIDQPGLPRANTAPSTENPRPTSTEQLTVLEAHCSYFDPDNDGIVWPANTFRGFRNIGFNIVLAALAVVVIHGTFSYFTQTSWIPDPRFPLYLKKMYRCKHGSDSETYDTEGRYVPAHFEAIFSKFAKKHKDALSLGDIGAMIRANRNIMDPVGWTAAVLEWSALWWIAADEDGLLTKERVRASYDGTLWYTLEREQQDKKEKSRKQRRAHRPTHTPVHVD